MINGYNLFLTITKIDNYQNNKSPAEKSAGLFISDRISITSAYPSRNSKRFRRHSSRQTNHF